MAMYTYTLQTVTYGSGSVLFEGLCTTSGLTVPSFASLKIAGEISEMIDAVTGEYQIGDCEFEFEDESGHFWRDFLSADTAEIKLTITESAGVSVLFWGVVQPLSDNADEYDLYTVQRRGVFTCKSKIVDLKNVDIPAVFTACAADMVSLTEWTLAKGGSPAGSVGKIMNIKRFMARMFEQLNGTLDDDDIDVTGLQDIRYSADNVTYYEWHQMYFLCGTQDTGTLNVHWFKDEEWKSMFSNCFDLFAGLCRSLLVVPVWYYDSTASRYRVRMLTRGHSASAETPLVMGTVLNSQMNPAYNRKLKFIQATSGWSGASANTLSPQILTCTFDTTTWPGANPWSTTPPTGGVDLDLVAFFLGDESPTGDGSHPIERFYVYSSGTTAAACAHAATWDYVDNDWWPDYVFTSYALTAIAAYFRDRFNAQRRRYTRTYAGIGPTAAKQDTLRLLAAHDITGEDSVTRHFYATEIHRDVVGNSVTVVWEEI